MGMLQSREHQLLCGLVYVGWAVPSQINLEAIAMSGTITQPTQSTTQYFTANELHQFHRDGFVVVRGMADATVVRQIIEVTDEAVLRHTPPLEYESELGYPGAPTSFDALGGATPRRFKQALCRSPVLFDWATCPDVVHRLGQIFGSAPILSLAHHNAIMVKNPYFSSDTEWHRDLRYWNFLRSNLVTTHLALTPATPENGCLRFLPGSHTQSISAEQLDQAGFLRSDRPENRALLATELTIPLEPGDVVFFHCLTFHAARRNRSSEARKSVLFTYRAEDSSPIPHTRSAAYPELVLPT
jgi:phytanoyl-CoA hydroxylase